MVVFEMHVAKKYCVGFGVSLQPPKPLHTMSQKRCFWVPRMGVFEMDHAKKYCVGSDGTHVMALVLICWHDITVAAGVFRSSMDSVFLLVGTFCMAIFVCPE